MTDLERRMLGLLLVGHLALGLAMLMHLGWHFL